MRHRPQHMQYLLFLVLSAFFMVNPTKADACGQETACALGERSYRIALPDGPEPPRGAIVFAHGYKSSATATLANGALSGLANRLGLALIAAEGIDGTWNLPNRPGGQVAEGPDEIAYFEAIRSDAARRFGIDPGGFMVAGFSSGGMMVWELACRSGEAFAAFVAISGTFWNPVPQACPTTPAYLAHLHGTTDTVVPISGRPIGNTRQGDVREAIGMLLRQSDYGAPDVEATGDLNCSIRRDSEGRVLDICFHPGGHALRTDLIERAARATILAR